jgi:malonyl CoA-acyl carrier protein transacylase/thioesterase domain-containing protein
MSVPPEFEMKAEESQRSAGAGTHHLLVLSAETEAALEDAKQWLLEFLQRNNFADLSDLAYTLQVERQAFSHRWCLVCANGEEAIAALSEDASTRALTGRTGGTPRPVVFLLPGIGDHYVGMAHELYKTWDVFRQESDRCAQILAPQLGIDIRDILYPQNQSWKTAGQPKGIDLKKMLGRKINASDDPDTSRLNRTLFAQPALFTIEYALARLWQSLGVTPDAIVGHSMGEYVAACLAGVMSLEDALTLIATRARLVDALPPAAMLAVMLSEHDLCPLLPAGVSICLINGPSLCVVAGPALAVSELEQTLAARNVISRHVQNAHAFHSRTLDPIVDAFRAEVGRIPLHEPTIPYVSNVSGGWVTGVEATDPAYWANHVNHTARFSDALHHLWQLGDPILLECGPGRTLGVLAMQHPDRKITVLQGSISSLRQYYENQADQDVLLQAVGKLWLSGVAVAWDNLQPRGSRRLVSLPTYPSHGQDHGMATPSAILTELQDKTTSGQPVGSDEREAPSTTFATDRAPCSSAYLAPRNEMENTLAKVCERVLGVQRVGMGDNLFELGGHSLTVIRLAVEMKRATGMDINMGEMFRSSTIAELAASLASDAARSTRTMVPLQTEGEGLPIFCIFGIDIYREFAQSLGRNQPVFGVYVEEEQAIINEVLKGDVPVVSIKRLVDAYYEAITQFQPQGPYRLAALSFGGILAIELASKMRECGDQVELVFLLDTLLPEGRQRNWRKWILRQLVEVTTGRYRAKFHHVYTKLRQRLVGLAPVLSVLNRPQSVDGEFLQSGGDFVLRRTALFSRAAEQWQLRKLNIDFPVILFQASDHTWWGYDFDYAEDYGWRRYLGDRLSIVPVTGGHVTIVRAPFVSSIGQLGQRYLRPEPAKTGAAEIVMPEQV